MPAQSEIQRIEAFLGAQRPKGRGSGMAVSRMLHHEDRRAAWRKQLPKIKPRRRWKFPAPLPEPREESPEKAEEKTVEVSRYPFQPKRY